MKKITVCSCLLFSLAGFLVNNNCYPQVSEVGGLMAAGAHDAQLLLQPYITPAVNAFGAALGGGWYNTAKPHKLGGFDLTFTANICVIPKSKETFLIDDTQLDLLKLHDPGLGETPTIAGEKLEGPLLDYKFDEYSQAAFNMPKGINTNYIPAPMIQAGIGLIKGTEVMVRFLPNLHYKGNELGLWGIGGKHDIKQWIPGLNKVPVLEISIMYGFTKLHTLVDIDVTPDNINAGSLPGANSSAWDNQSMKLITRSQTANLIVGANLPVICIYGGVGFVSTRSNLKLEGDYPSVFIDGTTPSVKALVDPIDMDIKNKDGGVTKPRLNAGIRFKLAVITIHFDYSWSTYSVLTAGLGLSFR
jgi:hypothetical protein